MSGGAYNYAWVELSDFIEKLKIEGEEDCASVELRRAFNVHLRYVQLAMRAIELNDSNDGCGAETALIKKCLGLPLSDTEDAVVNEEMFW